MGRPRKPIMVITIDGFKKSVEINNLKDFYDANQSKLAYADFNSFRLTCFNYGKFNRLTFRLVYGRLILKSSDTVHVRQFSPAVQAMLKAKNFK